MNPHHSPPLSPSVRFSFAAFALLCVAAQASNAAVFFDPFEDGGRTNGADAEDIAWFEANQNQVLSVTNVAPSAGNYSMDVDVGGVDAFKRVVGFFTPTTLGANTGDYLELSFLFRLVATVGNNANGFRFGLYNSNGTQITTDDPSTSYNSSPGTREDDDFGYNARIPLGTATGPALIKEPSGDNTLGGGTAGANLTGLTTSNVGINDTSDHALLLRIERTGASSLSVTLNIDGIQYATGNDTSGIYSSFDAVYFGTGSTSSIDYRVDNVQFAVPEPSGALVLLLGLGSLALRRSRGSSPSKG